LSTGLSKVLPAHDLMRIRPVRAEHVSAWRFLVAGTAVDQDFSSHAVRLSGTFDAWRQATLEPGFRRMLDRKAKRFLKAEGAFVRRVTGDAGRAIEEIARLRAGRFAVDMIQQQAVLEFYSQVATAGQASGFARTYEIGIEGRPFGYAFGIAHAGCFFYLLIGCDYEAYGRHSPGLILYDFMIRDWISAGGNSFDFTIGDEPFKMQFGTTPTKMHAIERRAGLRGYAAAAALSAKAMLRSRSAAKDNRERADRGNDAEPS
jgi:CelD/BcsL family acetyltransferase involved in cellulose biosynthesis